MRTLKMWSSTVFFLLIPLVPSLKITGVSVPRLVDITEQAELHCGFELGTSRLNSIKWYKDEMEFFRYTPQPPTITIFPVIGTHVLKSQSNSTLVVLYPLEYNSTGWYLCEVSTEAPHFNVDRQSANMTVIGMPKYDPKISGIEPLYNVGEYITTNCTTAPSYPPPNVNWFINDIQASEWLQEHYHNPGTQNPYQLESRSVGLRFQLGAHHFLRDRLNLTCVAKVQGLIRSTSVAVFTVELKNQKYAQERSRNYSVSNGPMTSLATLMTSFALFVFL